MKIKTIILKISLVILSIEIFIMEMFNFLDIKFSNIVEGIIDSSFLVIFSTPIIYFWVIKPFIIIKNNVIEKNKKLAYFDSLTGLPNRIQFLEFLDEKFNNNNNNNFEFSLILIDIDDFKSFNNNYSLNIGDFIIKSLSENLTNFLKEKYLLFKISQDQFVININENLSKNEIYSISKNILEIIKTPIYFNECSFILSASIGISNYPLDTDNKEDLLKYAQISMSHAKKSEEDKIEFYKNELTEVSRYKFELQKDLRKAVDNNEFYLVYQPKINTKTKIMTGVEALIRWKHPTKGFISPADFIPLAEESGEIIKIGKWVLNECLKQFKIWEEEGKPPIVISINFSGRQLKENIVKEFLNIILNSKIPTKFIELEITETYLMKEPFATQKMLEEMKNIGISLAMDDFGYGYSSLGYLKKFKMDVLKIDMSLIQDIDIDKNDLSIVKSIISMGNSLEMKIVAEGVETEEQYNLLNEMNCDYIQGYYFSKPVLPSEIKF